jgi:hypothetical protein
MKRWLELITGVLAVVLCGVTPARAETFCIPKGNITNHADAAIQGSIAWHFAQYGAEHTYVLVTQVDYANPGQTIYTVDSTLTIPASATLTTGRWQARLAPQPPACVVDLQRTVQLRATSGLDDRQMIEADNYSTLENLDLHGNDTAGVIVRGMHKIGITISRCTIHDTKNDYTSELIGGAYHPRPHLVYLDSCSHATLTGSTFRRAGCEPKLNATQWIGGSAAIYAPDNEMLRVESNDIASTLSAGIDFTGTVRAVISGNVIQKIGLNALSPDCVHPSCAGMPPTSDAIADGITAYHNLNGFTYQDIVVRQNHIFDYHNHGIHLSGRDVYVEDNYVHDGKQNAIRIADQRSPADCASHFFIRNNTVNPGSVNPSAILVDNYKPGAFAIFGNTSNGSLVNATFGSNTCL